ncbi:MAG: hypothetical protein SGJ02_13875, partial [bacterium]|nr:hypothetical protein [bacterium]
MLNISKKSLIFLLFYSSHLFAQEYSFNGHLKTINSFTRYSSDDSQSQFDLKDSFRSDLNSRLNSQITEDAFKFVLQGDFVASGIENIAKQKKISDQFAPGISRQFFISDDSQFFDFSKTISEDGDVFTNLRLDRVFLHYE